MDRARRPFWLTGSLATLGLYLGESSTDESTTVILALLGLTLVTALLPPIRLSQRKETLLGLLLATIFLAEGLHRTDIRVLGAAHFLTAIQAVKLLKRPLDRGVLLVLALMQILVASTLTDRLFFAVPMVAFAGAAIWSLRQLRYPLQVVHQPGQPAGAVVRSLAGAGGAVLLAGLTVVLFPLLPRLPPGMVGAHLNPSYYTTGLSNRISLATSGRVYVDDTETLLVRSEYPHRLRGLVLDRYIDGRWTAAGRKITEFQTIPDWFIPLPGRSPEPGTPGETIQVEVLQGYSSNLVLAPRESVAIRCDFGELATDDRGTLQAGEDPVPGDRYELQVQSPGPWRDVGDAGSTADNRYRQVPTHLKVQFAGPARRIAEGAHQPKEKARRIMEHLRSQYTYSLSRRMRPLREDPTLHFLDTSRRGHCEHFASAMVLLLRSLDVPARVVTGFLPGEPGSEPGTFRVRQLHAHAWVEVEVAPGQWQDFDPTPGRVDSDRGPLLAWLEQIGQQLETRWRRQIVNFSLYDQRDLLQSLLAGTLAALHLAGRAIPLGIALLLLAAVGRLLWSLGRRWGLPLPTLRRRSPDRPAPTPGPGTELYRKVLAVLRQQGHPRPPSATPAEFARALRGQEHEAGGLLEEITGLYYLVRFGRPGKDGELERLRSLVTELERRTEAGPSETAAGSGSD